MATKKKKAKLAVTSIGKSSIKDLANAVKKLRNAVERERKKNRTLIISEAKRLKQKFAKEIQEIDDGLKFDFKPVISVKLHLTEVMLPKTYFQTCRNYNDSIDAQLFGSKQLQALRTKIVKLRAAVEKDIAPELLQFKNEVVNNLY